MSATYSPRIYIWRQYVRPRSLPFRSPHPRKKCITTAPVDGRVLIAPSPQILCLFTHDSTYDTHHHALEELAVLPPTDQTPPEGHEAVAPQPACNSLVQSNTALGQV